MGILAESFTKYLEEKQIRYGCKKIAVPGSEEECDRVQVIFAGTQRPDIAINFIFDDVNKDVHIRVIDIVPEIGKDRRPAALEIINEVNTLYNYARFCITDNGRLEFGMDALINEDCSAPFCYELMRKALKICVESYDCLCRI